MLDIPARICYAVRTYIGTFILETGGIGMTDLLLRILIGKKLKTDPEGAHAAIGSLAGITGIVCNCLLFAGKLGAGLLIGSVSFIADAVNNLSDAASSIITLAGFHLARRPADEDHPYGHARYEYVAGFVIALLVLLIGVETARGSVEKIISPAAVELGWAAALIMLASIVVKLWLCAFYRKLGARIQSTALMAAAVDSRNDVIATSAVLLGSIAQHYLGLSIDGWAGLGVALFILCSGAGIFRQTVSPLLGMQVNGELLQQIRSLILSHGQVLGIHDLLVHDYGPGRYYASVHVELNADEDPMICHDIIDDIEWDALRELNVQLVIHHDPIAVGDSELNEMRDLVEEIIAGIHPELALHDFRMVRTHARPRLMFDLEVPYAMAEQHDSIWREIDAALHARGKNCKIILRFDGKA